MLKLFFNKMLKMCEDKLLNASPLIPLLTCNISRSSDIRNDAKLLKNEQDSKDVKWILLNDSYHYI